MHMEHPFGRHPHNLSFRPFVVKRLDDNSRPSEPQIPFSAFKGNCFLYLSEGEVIVEMGNESLFVRGHQILVIPSGVHFSIKYHSGGVGQMGTFSNNVLKDSNYRVLQSVAPVLADVPDEDIGFVEAQLDKLLEESSNYRLTPLCQAVLDAFLAYTDHLASKGSLHHRNRLCSMFLEMVFDRGKPFGGVAAYAAELGVTANHLNRTIKLNTGKSAGTWIDISRITYAKLLLRKTDMPIIDVAAKAGFDDQSYFSRFFKKNEGCTPSGYRRDSEMI